MLDRAFNYYEVDQGGIFARDFTPKGGDHNTMAAKKKAAKKAAPKKAAKKAAPKKAAKKAAKKRK